MAAGGDRKKSLAGGSQAGRETDAVSSVDGPTEQGPADTGEERTEEHFIDPLTPNAYEEPELPKKDAGRSTTEQRAIAPDPEAGQTIGDYLLVSKLGRGGAGSVFQATRLSDGATVALKVLSASKAKRARIVQRFFDEARASSAVMHPGLIRVLDFIEEEEPRRLAYAMEFVDGESLRERLKREGALDLRDAIHIGIEVSDALDALHDAGIIHRDLKPENIMLLRQPPGSMPKVKLLDFGVVKFLPVDRAGGQGSNDVAPEKPGTFVGTPRYMAPEQAAGGIIDPRADLFAVGVLLFEMITGRCPHEGDSLRDVVMAKLKGAPRITVNPGKEILPQELTDVVDACLQLKPALRPKDAREVKRALREAVVVLFAVGPVKKDDAGVPFRPASIHGAVAPEAPGEGSAPRATPLVSSSHSREVVSVRHEPASGASQRALVDSAPTSGPHKPVESERKRGWIDAARGLGGRLWITASMIVVSAMVLTVVVLHLARSCEGEEVLLLPIESRAAPGPKDAPKNASGASIAPSSTAPSAGEPNAGTPLPNELAPSPGPPGRTVILPGPTPTKARIVPAHGPPLAPAGSPETVRTATAGH
jgi:serine/threonine-protein kinase